LLLQPIGAKSNWLAARPNCSQYWDMKRTLISWIVDHESKMIFKLWNEVSGDDNGFSISSNQLKCGRLELINDFHKLPIKLLVCWAVTLLVWKVVFLFQLTFCSSILFVFNFNEWFWTSVKITWFIIAVCVWHLNVQSFGNVLHNLFHCWFLFKEVGMLKLNSLETKQQPMILFVHLVFISTFLSSYKHVRKMIWYIFLMLESWYKSCPTQGWFCKDNSYASFLTCNSDN